MNTQFKKWSQDEEDQLLKEVQEGMPIYAIYRLHDRSKKAIELRLLDIAIRMRTKGLSDLEIEEKTKCTKESIDKRIAEKYAESKENNKTNLGSSNLSEPVALTILNELRDLRSLISKQSLQAV